MPNASQFEESIFRIRNEDQFNEAAIGIFRFQYRHNQVYHDFVKHLGTDIRTVSHYQDIPCMPIVFFKTHEIRCGDFVPEAVFTSSGTTGTVSSRHYVRRSVLYEESFTRCFERFFGDIRDIVFLALLPSYLERTGSSLVYMADKLIKNSGHPESGFYLDDHDRLAEMLRALKQQNRRVMLLGVSFALLDFAEKHSFPFPKLLLMETGGMKGRRREMTREELHGILGQAFHVENVCSEYGMTELLSQAYSLRAGRFYTPPWMKVIIRDVNDPFARVEGGKTGGVNIIDLANVNSCSFIASQDLGRAQDNGSFEILGRFDHSDLRGCNLLVV